MQGHAGRDRVRHRGKGEGRQGPGGKGEWWRGKDFKPDFSIFIRCCDFRDFEAFDLSKFQNPDF